MGKKKVRIVKSSAFVIPLVHVSKKISDNSLKMSSRFKPGNSPIRYLETVFSPFDMQNAFIMENNGVQNGGRGMSPWKDSSKEGEREENCILE